MKTLIILRHAKSDWFTDSVTDFDRPLNRKGMKDGRKVGVILAEKELVPQIVLCSSAARTKATLDLVLSSFEEHDSDCGVEPEYLDAIYQADPHTLRQIVSEQVDNLDCTMLVAHNPGCEMLVQQLTGQHVELRPAYVAILTINTKSWHDAILSHGQWSLAEILRP